MLAFEGLEDRAASMERKATGASSCTCRKGTEDHREMSGRV